MTLPLIVVALVLAVAILLLLVWSIKRRSGVRLHVSGEPGIDDMVLSLAGATHGDLVEGNRVKLMQNGDGFFPELMATIGEAKQSIHFEAFLCKRGKLLDDICSLLTRKAAEGIEVRLLIDGSGEKKIGKENVKKLEAAGARVVRFNPIRLSNLGRLNNRDHRKIVIVDGRVAFVGGHCLADRWLGDAEDKEHVRDISIRVEGPVVLRIQSAFSENWVEETGDVPAGQKYFPDTKPVGETRAHLAYTTPSNSSSAVAILHFLAIRAATKSITIQNPYFLPDPEAMEALGEAVKRGVKIRVMLPAAEASDSPMVQHASHHHFGTLLKAGVLIFEYYKTLLHQKVITVDGAWSAIGSTNFDDRSFKINDEISVGLYDKDIARELEEIFERDLKHATEVKLEEWKKRPIRHKLLDFSLYLFNEQL